MGNAQWNEFSQLQDEALLKLRAGVRRPGYTKGVQAMVLPSFENNHSYELLYSDRTGKDDSALAVRATWKRPVDADKFANPLSRLKQGPGVKLIPTIEELDAPISRKQIEKLLSRATSLVIPPFVVRDSVGLDGTSYELSMGHSLEGSIFKWWCDAPAAWQSLQDLLAEIVALVECAIEDR